MIYYKKLYSFSKYSNISFWDWLKALTASKTDTISKKAQKNTLKLFWGVLDSVLACSKLLLYQYSYRCLMYFSL